MEWNENYEPENETNDQPYEAEAETETEVEENAETESFEDIPEAPAESIDNGLNDRLDVLIELLTPEESEDTGENGEDTETDTYSDSSAADYAYTQELLENINGTLVAIKWENASYYAESLTLQKENNELMLNIKECVELSSLFILVILFFVCFSCGNRFADTFFNRMKG